MHRHTYALEIKRGQRFESSRANWMKLAYIQQMYNIIYAKMVDAGVAMFIDEVFTNGKGEVVSEEEKYGRANNIRITHPDYVCMMDETGCNTSQKMMVLMGEK